MSSLAQHSGATESRPGALVISLDFELHWGVRDHCAADGPYRQVLLDTREVVGALLELFQEYEIAATWATVGMLMAETSEMLARLQPQELPRYANARLNPYSEPVGSGEADDPLHFAPSLVERIRKTPRQEIGTHTYSHYYCGEQGATPAAFRADLRVAHELPAEQDLELRSIVFPRNQAASEYVAIAAASGLDVYRSNPDRWQWRVENAASGRQPFRRLARLLETWFPVGGDETIGWDQVVVRDGLVALPASLFLRPYDARFALLENRKLRRISQAIRRAAKLRRIFHLWWHPHNFGAHQHENLEFLRSVLATFSDCREKYGMRSLTMAEAADLARDGSNCSGRVLEKVAQK